MAIQMMQDNLKPARMGNNHMLQLGKKAKDKITGFEGVITGKASYIIGCDQYLLQPPAKDGEFKQGNWFDEMRMAALNVMHL